MINFDFDIWIYDFEIFKHDWCVTFKKYSDENIIKSFVNDREAVKKFYYDNIHYNAVLVGYNNKWYDDFILRALLHDCDLYAVNNWIINEKRNPWEYVGLRFKKNHLISFDIMGEMAIGAPISLKQLEGYFGWRIFELPIPFDIDRPLTNEELDLVLEYNIYDVEATYKIFDRFGAKLKSHIAVIDYYNLELKKLNISGASKAALALDAKKIEKYESFKYECPLNVKSVLEKIGAYDILNKFENHIYYVDKEKKEALNFIEKLRDFDFYFALGGGHGAIPNYESTNEIWNLDVKSYYVSLMCQFDFISRSLGVNGKEKLYNLLQLRIDKKNNGDVDLADGLKMLLVAIYGSMAFENSIMWDVKMQTSVCITGQLLLYILCKNLEPYSKIIQINTDGIMIEPIDKDKCVNVYQKWEKDFNMELELEVGNRIIQKDVNNYIFLKNKIENIDWNDKKNVNKNVKVKGMAVRFFNIRMQDQEFGQLANFTINNNYTIVDEAVVKHLLLNENIENIIRGCKDLIRFQFVLKLMGNFKAVCYKKNEEYFNFEDPKLNNLKCYRLFAVKNGYDIYKKKINEDDSIQYSKVSKSSKNMIILNDDLKIYNFEDINIDYNHYIQMAQDVINLYKNKIEEESQDDKEGDPIF